MAFVIGVLDDAPWPVDLDQCRLWPMESADGPLLQELLDDLSDFPLAFGERGAADAVSTFIALPEGLDYTSKLLLGVWRDGGLVGALDAIMGYPTGSAWTVGLLAVAERHRRQGVGTAVLSWLESSAAERGARRVRVGVRPANAAGRAFLSARGYRVDDIEAAGPQMVMTQTLSEEAGPVESARHVE